MKTGGPVEQPEDLSARSRRGHASFDEERELLRALEASATLRTAHKVGMDLDRSTAIRPGDEDLILAAADAALARVTGHRGAASGEPRIEVRAGSRKHPRKIAAALVAAATITASGMAAAWWTGIAKLPWLAPPAAVMQQPHEQALAHGAAKRDVPLSPAEPAPLPLPAEATREKAEPVARLSTRRARNDEPSAAELFSVANSARRAGDFTEARRAYSRLIAKYPSSDEAQLSQVSLGKLLLANGEAAEAEREFRRYLSNKTEPLAEEALVSQAESLSAMNRPKDERRAWQKLLAEHPNSVYAARARARLGALGP